MDRTSIWAENTDYNISTFLTLLLMYGYVWKKNNEPLRLHLSKTKTNDFLSNCRNLVDDLDEKAAAIKIELIKICFTEEYYRLKNNSKTPDESILPWYSDAYQLFQEAAENPTPIICNAVENPTPIICNAVKTPTPIIRDGLDALEAIIIGFLNSDSASVASSSTSSVTPDTPPVSNPVVPISVLYLSSTLTPSSSLPSISVAQTVPSETSALNWKLPSHGEHLKDSTNFYASSMGNKYEGESYPKYRKLQHDFPTKIPSYILSKDNHNRSKNKLTIPNTQIESEPLSANQIPIAQSDESRPQTPDISFISENKRISSLTNNNTIYLTQMPSGTGCKDFPDENSPLQWFKNPLVKNPILSRILKGEYSGYNRSEGKDPASNHTKEKSSSSVKTKRKYSALHALKPSHLPPIRASFPSSTKSSTPTFFSVSSPVASIISKQETNKNYSPFTSRHSSLPISKDSSCLKVNYPQPTMVNPTLSFAKVTSKVTTSMMPVTYDEPLNLSVTKTTALATASSLTSTSVVQTFSWSTLIPYWKNAFPSNTPPASIPTSPIIEAPTLTTVSLQPTFVNQPHTRTILLHHRKLPSLEEKLKVSPNFPSTLPSVRNIVLEESTSNNMGFQYDFPVLYPFCIVPEASLGQFRDTLGTSYSEYETMSLSGNKAPIMDSSSISYPEYEIRSLSENKAHGRQSPSISRSEYGEGSLSGNEAPDMDSKSISYLEYAFRSLSLNEAPVKDSPSISCSEYEIGNLSRNETPVKDSPSISCSEYEIGALSRNEAPVMDSPSISCSEYEIGTLTRNDAPVMDSPSISCSEYEIGTLTRNDAPVMDSPSISCSEDEIGAVLRNEASVKDSPSISCSEYEIDALSRNKTPVRDIPGVPCSEYEIGTLARNEAPVMGSPSISCSEYEIGTLSRNETPVMDSPSISSSEYEIGALSRNEAHVKDSPGISCSEYEIDALSRNEATESPGEKPLNVSYIDSSNKIFNPKTL